ncbi:FAD-binding oxidoreductase [Hydrogenophaga sp. OTU3427]|uniref:FAD-binding oxidoreductase n=1 Tax=Hydrogenophaga sp. OTU3427 TaxID=3043856 RepID=UPI00313BB9A0
MTPLSHPFIQALTEALGADAVRTGDTIPPERHTDWSGTQPLAPLAWLRPASTAQVSAALRLCHAHRVPVVPQGGLTGLAGGAVPTPGSVALSLERMSAIETLDPVARVATVQAGATLQAVQEAAQAAGCLFGVDLGARGSCQIGGNLATNAGGNGVVQFGMMREQTLGLEVVLADGTVLDMLRPMVKNNTGYDLKQFFIGAEGTLGIITRAQLRLQPAQPARATALAAVPDVTSALELLGRLQARAPGGVAAFELMWQDFLRHALDWTGLPRPFDEDHPLLALTDLSGSDQPALAHALEEVLGQAMEDGLVLDAVLAQSQAQATGLWRLREITAEFPSRLSPINFDISLPQAAIGAFADRCMAALSARFPGHRSLRFGHLGDGNLHLSTDARSLGDLSFAEAEHAVEAIVYALVAEAGGSVSAEHGIGLHKKPHLSASRGPAELAAMRAIKRALDPLNLLNPGKVFDLD